MSVYTVQFGAQNFTAGGTATIYTAPAGSTSVVRDLRVTNGDGTDEQLWVQINVSGSLSAYLYRDPSHPATTTVGLELRQVVNVGDTIEVGTTGTNATFIVTGYQLS